MISDQLSKKASILFNEVPALKKWSQVHTSLAVYPNNLSKGLEVHINKIYKIQCPRVLLQITQANEQKVHTKMKCFLPNKPIST